MKKSIFRGVLLGLLFVMFAGAFQVVSAESYDNATTTETKMRSCIKNHQGSVTFRYTDNTNPLQVLYTKILGRKTNGEHIKEKQSDRGDYLSRMYLSSIILDSNPPRVEKGKCVYTYTVTFKYAISKGKSNYVDKKCKSVAKKTKGMSKKKKVTYICKWLTKNMSYKKTSADNLYHPLKTKKGKCVHYAYLFCKIGKDAGLNTRVVSGKIKGAGHSWCVVKIGGKWYQVDPTWADGGKKIKSKWILKGIGNKTFNKNRKISPHYKTILKT